MKIRVVPAAALWCVAGTFVAGLQAQRLPTTVRPEHYTLHLTPDLKAATFAGSETIDVVLEGASKSITLNSAEIKIGQATARAGSGAAQTGTVSYDEEKEQATLSFPAMLPAGKVTLALEYTGILNDKLRGFYLSKTQKRNYAVTQFESTDARRAFPSFDEPALKATFDLSLTIDKGDTVIANTNMLSDTPAADGMHTQTFARTPRMSTYLLAFQVGDWKCSSGEADGIPIRACSTPDKVALTPFSVEAAEHFLHYYDQYFGVKYAMPKLDLIGIPDFEAGAMENWGCITYRETALLVDAKTASLDAKKNVAVVVAHEMAHQWFGDLVTLAWWNNTWLNEGFATWMESKAVKEWQPAWGLAEDDALTLNGTLNVDAAPVTRAIRSKADTPAEINQQFDSISYGKAGAVLGMVEHYVGPAVFQKGVQQYLQAHKFANATAEDFWGTMTTASGKPVDKIMESFVAQPGEPLLRFAPGGEGKLTVQQSRFYLTPKPDTSAQSWTIPVCVKGSACQVISGPSSIVPSGAMFANAEGVGYFRSDYSPELLKQVIASAPSLSAPERINLAGDRLALMRAGQSSIGDTLDLLSALRNDPSAQVLTQALQGVSTAGRIADTAQVEELRAWVRRTFGPAYSSMSTEQTGTAAVGAAEAGQERRAVLFSTLGGVNDPTVVAEARSNVSKLLAGGAVEPQMVASSLSIAAAHGDAALYEQLQHAAETMQDPVLKTQALYMLARFTDPALAQRTLDYARSGKVRNQDSYVLFIILLQQRDTRSLAWTYMKNNWDKVKAQFTTFSGAGVVSATGSFCSAEDRADVQQFFATHKVEASDRALQSALNSIDACVRLKAEQGPKLAAWLSAHGGQ